MMEFALMTRNLILPASFLIIGLLTTACGRASTTASAEVQAAAPPAAIVEVAAVRATIGTIQSTLEISGTLAPRTRVGVQPKLPGRLERVLVDIGDRVV